MDFSVLIIQGQGFCYQTARAQRYWPELVLYLMVRARIQRPEQLLMSRFLMGSYYFMFITIIIIIIVILTSIIVIIERFLMGYYLPIHHISLGSFQYSKRRSYHYNYLVMVSTGPFGLCLCF